MSSTPMGAPQGEVRRCTICKSILNSDAAFCPNCGVPVQEPSSALQGRTVQSAQAVTPPSELSNAWPSIRILLAVALAYFLSWETYGGSVSAEQFGYCLGSLLIPFLIAFCVARRDAAERLQTFSKWFLGSAAAVLLITHLGAKPGAPPPEQFTREILKEAVSNKPTNESGTVEEQRVRTVAAEVVRELLDARKQHDIESAQYDHEIARLYSADSFASKEQMRKTIDAVDGRDHVDGQLEELFRTLPAFAQRKVDASDLSSYDKEQFMIGVKKSYANSELIGAWDSAQRVEDEWTHSIDGLYEFAIQHANQIRIVKHNIVIKDEHLREEFNSQLSKCQGLGKQLRAATKKINEMKKSKMSALGITNEDLGLSK